MLSLFSPPIFHVRGYSRKNMHQPQKKRVQVAKEQEVKPWFAAGEADNAAPEVSAEELTPCLLLIIKIYAAHVALVIHGVLLFCWCSSHERKAEMHMEHSGYLHAYIWWWNGVNVKHRSVLGQKEWDTEGKATAGLILLDTLQLFYLEMQ